MSILTSKSCFSQLFIIKSSFSLKNPIFARKTQFSARKLVYGRIFSQQTHILSSKSRFPLKIHIYLIKPQFLTDFYQFHTKIPDFQTKVIRFGPIDYRIVTQNLNGPCPLIAIINTLVLKGKVTIPAVYVVTSTELLNLLSNVILSAEPSNQKTKEIYEANLRDVMNLMPTLVNGLDVNVKFSAVNQFEFTPALSLFDLVHINLYHVWLPDPQFPVIFDLIKSLNYNELVEKICAESDTVEREMYKSWYEDTQSQITFIGVQSLFTEMKDAELAVLFQNNHFSTILRRRFVNRRESL
ncbi:hypothetical protein CRE_26757 [Caenorhabditis remanei]|uniref:Ubiquitin carboxyl-terminal hydrolase n=1 Tax=Caenorhabditis remanei TaxID=31234 RepID=E3MXW1_CAERE|nr:hypothetical protein CRE_26757 [Caenorhabditis remanei]